MNYQIDIERLRSGLLERLGKISAETLGWTAVIVMHATTMPTLLALMTGLSDRTPSLDVVMLLWTALVCMFVRAIVLKDTLNIVTIGGGFIVQAVIMALILFR